MTTAPIPPGAVIRVRDDWPERHGPVHVRTPHYLRGRTGQVLRHLGDYPDPEALAFGRAAPIRRLYHVAFDPHEIWPDADADGRLMVELYDHWLETA